MRTDSLSEFIFRKIKEEGVSCTYDPPSYFILNNFPGIGRFPDAVS